MSDPRGLPQHMHLRAGRYYYVKRNDHGKLIWTSLSRDFSEALHQHRLIEGGKIAEALEAVEAPPNWLSGYSRVLHAQAKRRAADADILFELTVNDVATLAMANNWRCSLTGIRFSKDEAGKKGARPYMPSVDRIDCTRGYTRDNCRLVCVAVNFAMNSWGEAVFNRIATAYVHQTGISTRLERSNRTGAKKAGSAP